MYSSLTDVERLEYFAQEGIDSEIIPTVTMRPVVEWALKYYFDSGCTQAPSREALMLEWRHVLEAEDITLDEVEDEIETPQWVLEYLRSTFVHLQWQQWSKKAATDMANAFTADRVEVMADHASGLAMLLSKVRSRKNEAIGLEAFDDAIRRYHERAARGDEPQGLMFGMPMVDEHTGGIRDGEIAVLAAGPKTGKSYVLAKSVLHEWAAGRRGMLFTLENSVDMTIDRIVCMHAVVNSRRWQRGECEPEELERVRLSRSVLAEMIGEMIVVMPPPGHRTVDAMVREAQIRGADSLLIDQLTFIDHPAPGRKQRYEIVGEIMRELKTSISTGSYKMPCLLAHQINREGVKAADKTGYLEMHMLAESAEVERTADWVFGLYRSLEERIAQIAKLQVLASRREDITNWILAYDPAIGLMNPERELALGVTT